MSESIVTGEGQAAVPADILAAVGAKPGTRLVWSVMSNGTISVRAKTKSLSDLAGILKAPEGTHVSIDEMSR